MASDRRRQIRAASLALVIAGVGTIGWRWYSYVTAGDTPYENSGSR